MKRAWIALLALALAACGAASPHSGHAPATVGVTIGAEDFRFEPASLELIAGQTVTIAVHNTGSQSHDFTIAALPLDGAAVSAGSSAGHEHMHGAAADAAVHVAVDPGATGTVEFTPTAAGTYEFDCTVPGHKAAGMVGQLVVKAP